MNKVKRGGSRRVNISEIYISNTGTTHINLKDKNIWWRKNRRKLLRTSYFFLPLIIVFQFVHKMSHVLLIIATLFIIAFSISIFYANI